MVSVQPSRFDARTMEFARPLPLCRRSGYKIDIRKWGGDEHRSRKIRGVRHAF